MLIFSLAFILITSLSEVFTKLPIVVVLSFDGFRSEFYNKNTAPKLFALHERSSGTRYFENIFPTKSFVNLFSLSTGVYPNEHGVYGNTMFEDDGKVMPYAAKQFQYNKDIIPIWIGNQMAKDGRHSAVMMWPGADFEYNNIKPTYIVPYNSEDNNWSGRANTIINWITRKNHKANLVMAHFEYTPCHDKTKLDDHIARHMKEVDEMINQIYTGIMDKMDKINMIILSDFGTKRVTHQGVMLIENYVQNDPYIQTIVSGPLVYIKTSQNDYLKVENHIKNHKDWNVKFRSYKINELLKNWFMKKISILQYVIVLVAIPGYTFYEKEKFDKKINDIGGVKDNFVTEENGYDNNLPDMGGFLMAIGPSFKRNVLKYGIITVTDVYPLLRHLLTLPDNASVVQNRTLMTPTVESLLNIYYND